MLMGVTFHCTFTNLRTKLDIYPLLQILVTLLRHLYAMDMYYFLCC
jgi:hypothetical protein